MFEKSFEIGRILAVKGSRLVLVEVVRGHPQGDAPPNFFPVSKCSILGLSNEVSFVSRFFCKHGENQGEEKSVTWPPDEYTLGCEEFYSNLNKFTIFNQ